MNQKIIDMISEQEMERRFYYDRNEKFEKLCVEMIHELGLMNDDEDDVMIGLARLELEKIKNIFTNRKDG